MAGVEYTNIVIVTLEHNILDAKQRSNRKMDNSSHDTPNPPLQTQQEFRAEMFNNAEHSERMVLRYRAGQAIFAEAINRILDEYKLTERLQKAVQNNQKLRILQLNCAEGLFLHELARLLEERGLLKGADLFGISADVAQITTAEGYSRLSTPPRPYLNFYLHDIHQPLEDCLGLHENLKVTAPTTFDLIFSPSEALRFTKNAAKVLERLYTNNLKPGGLILLTESILIEGAEGWITPHPILAELLRPILNPIYSYNPDVVDVAEAIAGWLEELGASEVQSFKVKQAWGGYSEQGRYLLRSSIVFLNVARPQYVQGGLMTAAHFDELLGTLYREIAPQHEGFTHFITTFGRKPI
jgi:hypothetical protein